MKQIYHKKHMARVGDLYPDYEKYNWLKGEGNIARKYGKRTKCNLARGIFHSFMNLVLDDILEGHMIKFPKYDAVLYIEHPNKDVLDLIQSQGKGMKFEELGIKTPAMPVYRFKDRRGLAHKFRVIMDKARYNTLLRNLIENKQYSTNIGIW